METRLLNNDTSTNNDDTDDTDYFSEYDTIDETYPPEFDQYEVYNESKEVYTCFSCSWEGEDPYVVNAYGEDYFLCPLCGKDLGI